MGIAGLEFITYLEVINVKIINKISSQELMRNLFPQRTGSNRNSHPLGAVEMKSRNGFLEER